MMDYRIDKALLRKFLAGECNGDDAARVNRFLQEPEGMALLEEVMQEQWEQAAPVPVETGQLAAWWSELREKLPMGERESGHHLQAPGWRFLSRRAAIWILLASVASLFGLLWLKRDAGQQHLAIRMEEQANPLGRRSDFTLADGTRIYLGAGSKLSYPNRFAGQTREVRLEGEAYFEVAEDSGKPFMIHTGDIRTQVLGTSFKITAFTGKPLTVAVTSGKVRVDNLAKDPMEQLAVLTPGQQLTYSGGGQSQVVAVSAADVALWKEGKLVFSGTALHELTEEISRWYNVPIHIRSEGLSQIPITVTLDANVPIEKLLNALSITIGCSYAFENKQVVLYQ